MGTVLIIMLAGIVTGFFIKKREKVVQLNDKLVMVAIFALLFFMGVAIGRDDRIMQSLPKLGLEALMIAILAVAGSVIVAFLVYKALFKTRVNS